MVFVSRTLRGKSGELRSVVVESGDTVLFTRGVIHTFTALLSDLTLLSYHAPFFEFDDSRQFTILRLAERARFVWSPAHLHKPAQITTRGERDVQKVETL